MTAPITPTPEPIGCALLRIMVAIALKQPDPRERDAMLDILRKNGWLK